MVMETIRVRVGFRFFFCVSIRLILCEDVYVYTNVFLVARLLFCGKLFFASGQYLVVLK
jgi:hypothetical protein